MLTSKINFVMQKRCFNEVKVMVAVVRHMSAKILCDLCLIIIMCIYLIPIYSSSPFPELPLHPTQFNCSTQTTYYKVLFTRDGLCILYMHACVKNILYSCDDSQTHRSWATATRLSQLSFLIFADPHFTVMAQLYSSITSIYQRRQ